MLKHSRKCVPFAVAFLLSALGCGDSNAPETATTIAINAGDGQTAIAGARVAVPPSVKITSARGNPVSGVSVTFAVAQGGGTITGATQTSDASGIATVGSWTLGTTAGLNSLTATSAPLTGSPITFTATGTAGAPSQIRVQSGDGQNAVAGSAVASPPTVVVQDVNNNPVAGVQVTFAVASGGGSITGATPTTDASGLAAVGSWTLGPTPGPNTLTVTFAGMVGSPLIITASGKTPFANLTAGGYHTCGVTSGGVAYCWGDNSYGQLGDATFTRRSTPVSVSGGLTFTSLAAGDHTCGLTSTGMAYCWGNNITGQLGDGTRTNRSAPVAVQGGLTFVHVAVGFLHTCGLTSGGVAYCWGYNDQGQLGDGSTLDRSTPVAVSGGLTFASLALGQRHSCGRTGDGAAYCWGWNYFGQLGAGLTTGGVFGDPSTRRTAPVAVSGGLTFESLTAGGDHTCGLTTNGLMYCWGGNDDGRLGDGSTTDRNVPVAVSGGLAFASHDAGTGVGTGGPGGHTCGLVGTTMYCWGSGSFGRLGNGTTDNRTVPSAVSGGLTFAKVSAGLVHTCGLTTRGAAYCWGRNLDGQVGDGSTAQRTTPVAVLHP